MKPTAAPRSLASYTVRRTADERSLIDPAVLPCTMPTTCPDCLAPDAKLESAPRCTSCQQYLDDPKEQKRRESFICRTFETIGAAGSVPGPTLRQILGTDSGRKCSEAVRKSALRASRAAAKRRREQTRREELSIRNRKRRAEYESSKIALAAPD